MAGRGDVFRRPAASFLPPPEKLLIVESIVNIIPQRGRLVAMSEEPRDRLYPVPPVSGVWAAQRCMRRVVLAGFILNAEFDFDSQRFSCRPQQTVFKLV